ncbi:MAG: hypothetical protein M1839_008167 [Geoglossum umbratile]|nr:MAG: hypothetical protein M1839_008167 [Geoglossum umbratile]
MRSLVAWLEHFASIFSASGAWTSPFHLKRDSSAEIRVRNGLWHLIKLNGNADKCMPPSVVLLWLATYCALPAITSLALGSSTFRRRVVAIRRRYCGSLDETHTMIVSIAGSVLIQIAATVGTGRILQTNDHSAILGSMVLLWFSRPLATPIIQWLTLVNVTEYLENSLEIARVDIIYGMVSVAMFGTAAKVTNQKHVPHPAQLARAGSALGILHFLFTIFVLAVFAFVIYSGNAEPRLRVTDLIIPRSKPSITDIILPFCHSSLRFTACWLLFAGLLFTNPTAFCPEPRTMKRILALWLFVEVLDHFWRMLAGRDGNDNSDVASNSDVTSDSGSD